MNKYESFLRTSEIGSKIVIKPDHVRLLERMIADIEHEASKFRELSLYKKTATQVVYNLLGNTDFLTGKVNLKKVDFSDSNLNSLYATDDCIDVKLLTYRIEGVIAGARQTTSKKIAIDIPRLEDATYTIKWK